MATTEPSVASRIRANEKMGMNPKRAVEAGYEKPTSKPTMDPEEAGLRPADPATPESCGVCQNFLGDSCSVVKGTIMPDMVSDQFVPAQREEPVVQPGAGGRMGMASRPDTMSPPAGMV